jgi:hypothetical protein
VWSSCFQVKVIGYKANPNGITNQISHVVSKVQSPKQGTL